MTKDSKPLEQEKALRLLRLGDLRVSAESQRGFRQHHADDLLARFDIDEMETPHVHERGDGTLYIVDGQHSVWALEQWLGSDADDQKLHCWLYRTGLVGEKAEEWEARKFRALNHRLNTNVWDDFRLAVKAGEPVENDILRTVRTQGLVISKEAVPGAIRAVGTLRKVYRRSNAEILGRTLRIIRDSFADSGFEGPIIDGIGHLCQRYNGSLDEAHASVKLSKVPHGAKGLLQQAHVIKERMGGTLAHAVAAAAVEAINRGRGGGKLPSWWKAPS